MNIELENFKKEIESAKKEILIIQENKFILEHSLTHSEILDIKLKDEKYYIKRLYGLTLELELNTPYKEFLKNSIKAKNNLNKNELFISTYLPLWLRYKKSDWDNFMWNKLEYTPKNQFEIYDCKVNLNEDGKIELIIPEFRKGMIIDIDEL